MSPDYTERNGTASELLNVERCKDTLNELNDLFADNLEATVGERGTRDFYEVYVIPHPDPTSAVRLVMLHSTKGELFHAATFDIDSLGNDHRAREDDGSIV